MGPGATRCRMRRCKLTASSDSTGAAGAFFSDAGVPSRATAVVQRLLEDAGRSWRVATRGASWRVRVRHRTNERDLPRERARAGSSGVRVSSDAGAVFFWEPYGRAPEKGQEWGGISSQELSPLDNVVDVLRDSMERQIKAAGRRRGGAGVTNNWLKLSVFREKPQTRRSDGAVLLDIHESIAECFMVSPSRFAMLLIY